MNLTDKDTGRIHTTALTVTEDYAITDIDDVGYIYVSTGASDVTVFLPAVFENTSTDQRKIYVKKTDSGSGAVIVEGANRGLGGEENIDGSNRVYLECQNCEITVKAGDSATKTWHTLSRLLPQIMVGLHDGIEEDVVAVGPGALANWLPGLGINDMAILGVNGAANYTGTSGAGVGEDVLENASCKYVFAGGEDNMRNATADSCDSTGRDGMWSNDGTWCSGRGRKNLRNNSGKHVIGDGPNTGINNTENYRYYLHNSLNDEGDDTLATGHFVERWFRVNGDLQIRDAKIIPQSLTTIDDTPAITAGEMDLEIPNNTTWNFIMQVSAYNNQDEIGAGWTFKGVVVRPFEGAGRMLDGYTVDHWYEVGMEDCHAEPDLDLEAIFPEFPTYLVAGVTGLAGKTIVWKVKIDIT